MSLRDCQSRVDAWISQFEEGYFPPLTNLCRLTEEVGELAEAVRKRDRAEIAAEVADVLAWLVTISSIAGVDVEEAALAKYGRGCPRCRSIPCACPP